MALVYTPKLAEYDLGPRHPLRPERVTLTVALMRAYGLLGEAEGQAVTLEPGPASDDDLLLVHSPEYIEAIKRSSAPPYHPDIHHGIGTPDVPVVRRMHEISALICGGAVLGLRAVLDGRVRRSFNVAGGLHHAHRDQAAGFCIYNDPAVAIARALEDDPGLRVCYLDVDAHHGDGVQEAFYSDARVLTVSIHESGAHLFPGTGFPPDTGEGAGSGYALNVPLPPGAGDACYSLAFERAAAPAVRAFAPHVIVAQCGADSHRDDPLAHLDTTVAGYSDLARRIVALADEVCDGRIAACGGGGYAWWSAVPRIWTCVLAALLGRELPETLPEEWRYRLEAVTEGRHAPHTLFEEDPARADHEQAARLARVEREIAELAEHTPLLGGTP